MIRYEKYWLVFSEWTNLCGNGWSSQPRSMHDRRGTNSNWIHTIVQWNWNDINTASFHQICRQYLWSHGEGHLCNGWIVEYKVRMTCGVCRRRFWRYIIQWWLRASWREWRYFMRVCRALWTNRLSCTVTHLYDANSLCNILSTWIAQEKSTTFNAN